MSSSSNANDAMSSYPGSDRGSGFSMKKIVVGAAFALCAASPISGAMFMPGMDPMMSGMGMGGMPPMGMNPMMSPMGMGMNPMMSPMGMNGMSPMGMGMSPMGMHWKHGRNYGLFGLRHRRGKWVPNNPYMMGMPGMGMPGMGMPGMGMGMPGGLPPLGGPMY